MERVAGILDHLSRAQGDQARLPEALVNSSHPFYGLVTRSTQEAKVDVGADGVTRAFAVPQPKGLSTAYFLRLRLEDSTGRPLSTNFYWLSTKLDTMDWKHKQDTVYTPQKDFADLTGLNSLPLVKLETQPSVYALGDQRLIKLNVKNTSNTVAFMVHARLTKGPDGDDLVPVFWDDNYFSLLPGEEKTITASFASANMDGHGSRLTIDGYNVAPTEASYGH